jgi:transposase
LATSAPPRTAGHHDQKCARILAQLLTADFLPPVWLPDEHTRVLRRIIARRTHLVRQRTRLKNQVHAILARNLMPCPPVSDLFGDRGHRWLARQDFPEDEHRLVGALLRQLDFHGDELAEVDLDLAQAALGDPVVRRLMTVPGIDSGIAVRDQAPPGRGDDRRRSGRRGGGTVGDRGRSIRAGRSFEPDHAPPQSAFRQRPGAHSRLRITA